MKRIKRQILLDVRILSYLYEKHLKKEKVHVTEIAKHFDKAYDNTFKIVKLFDEHNFINKTVEGVKKIIELTELGLQKAEYANKLIEVINQS